ncbi:hypothetical protein SAY87_013977 [Trapa incisa]|uniref:RRM domain-containing protein n=1 Tax=Trapa incisa TaxID=236973 RepID=A0AAN7GN26_9MYRT|nr:hypothetical protein SAY87_013977 [Trapa incisa]
MSKATLKVSNISLRATERDIREFFSFSGDIVYVEMQSDAEQTQIAYVTFKDSQGAETSILLSGGTIVDMPVDISLAPDYKLPPAATETPVISNQAPSAAESAFRKAKDVMSSMLAKGFIVGKDAVGKAKSFDEKHQLTSTASLKVASFDKRIGLSEKISVGTALVSEKISIGTAAASEKVREVDQRFQISEKSKSAFFAAEQGVSNAGSAIMKNRYVFTGASWVAGAFSRAVKAVGDVGHMTKEKMDMAEEEQKRKVVDDFAHAQSSESSQQKPSKPGPGQGLIL